MKTKIFQFILGLNLMSIGIVFYLKANIGLGSWDVLHNNLHEFYQLTFGTWVFIVSIITILFSQLFYYNFSSLLAIGTGFILGLLIDLWHDYILLFYIPQLYLRIPLFLIGLTLLGSGIALLVKSKLPPTAPDIFMISLMKRFTLNYLVAKTITELCVFIIAIIIGSVHGKVFNNIGIGTILSLILIGSIVEESSRLWKKLFRDI